MRQNTVQSKFLSFYRGYRETKKTDQQFTILYTLRYTKSHDVYSTI